MVTRAEQAENDKKRRYIRARANWRALVIVSDRFPEELENEKQRLRLDGETAHAVSPKARRRVAMRRPFDVMTLRSVIFEKMAAEEGWCSIAERQPRDGNNQRFTSQYKEEVSE